MIPRRVLACAVSSLLVPVTGAPSLGDEATSARGAALFAPGRISTGDYESHPMFTPDGATLYFLKNTPNFDFWSIVYSRKEKGEWSPPQVAPFSGQYSDADPFITPDGSKLYFISNRPLEPKPGAAPREDLDIWLVERAGPTVEWGAPTHLGVPVNSAGNEWFPTVATDGTLYFGSDREGGKGRTDLWRCPRAADGSYGAAENLGDSLNTPFNEFEPLIAPDQSYIIFMAGGRADSRGGFDLYLARQRDGVWGRPVNLGDAINSRGNELGPMITPDRRRFFWTSTRSLVDDPPVSRMSYAKLLERIRGAGNGLGDIYEIDVRELGLDR